MLAEFFPKSDHVGFRTFAIDQSIRARLDQRLGYTPARDKYTVFVATTQGKADGYAGVDKYPVCIAPAQGRVDGYAVVDDEKGLPQPITFATRLSSRGIVERVEI